MRVVFVTKVRADGSTYLDLDSSCRWDSITTESSLRGYIYNGMLMTPLNANELLLMRELRVSYDDEYALYELTKFDTEVSD